MWISRIYSTVCGLQNTFYCKLHSQVLPKTQAMAEVAQLPCCNIVHGSGANV